MNSNIFDENDYNFSVFLDTPFRGGAVGKFRFRFIIYNQELESCQKYSSPAYARKAGIKLLKKFHEE